ncbi:MAG: FKBP-type peptidyl-prolyl cis-trans isomerase [Planctomycetota bacterium]|jgi:FKBP-type peptidyl-prolyl cis-trans isomerase
MKTLQIISVLALVSLQSCSMFGNTKVEVTHELTEFDSGIKIREIVAGDGLSASFGQHIVIDYIGYLSDGSTFDSSIDRGVPLDFTLGEAPLAGWNEGINGMQIGGQRHISIPSNLAYGEAGIEGLIPPSEPLVFEVWLLEIQD